MKKPFYVIVCPLHTGVTGSCFLLKTVFPDGKTFSLVIDCGIFQEKEYAYLNDLPLPRRFKGAEAAVVTHNHVDHIGNLPSLVRAGFMGPIYCTKVTGELLTYSLNDCLHIQMTKAAMNKNPPPYKQTHITEVLRRLRTCEFGNRVQIHPNIHITMFRNGHVYGSALILIEINSGYNGEYPPINYLFTGDYNYRNPFFRIESLPEFLKEMPLHIMCESTYGQNGRLDEREPIFEENIIRHVNQGRDILIPTFAYERGQRILSVLRNMQNNKKLSLDVPIFLDGKLFRSYTKYYLEAAESDFVEEMQNFMPDNTTWIANGDERERIVNDDSQKIIVTTSGMGSYGPTQFYIPLLATNSNVVFHFTGFQCEGTVGRKLQDAKINGETVQVLGRMIKVNAKVYYTGEFSSHASQTDLIRFLGQFHNVKSITLNHGTAKAKEDLARRIIFDGIAKDVSMVERGLLYRYDPYRLVKIVEDEEIIRNS